MQVNTTLQDYRHTHLFVEVVLSLCTLTPKFSNTVSTCRKVDVQSSFRTWSETPYRIRRCDCSPTWSRDDLLIKTKRYVLITRIFKEFLFLVQKLEQSWGWNTFNHVSSICKMCVKNFNEDRTIKPTIHQSQVIMTTGTSN